jgi:hypothetical protein
MILSIVPKSGTPQLSTLGSVFPDLAQCPDCNSYIGIPLRGSFKKDGKWWLEFEVATVKMVKIDRIFISDRQQHVVDIVLVDDPNQVAATASYFLETDTNFAASPDWTLSFHVQRSSKKSIWKYTKGHGQGGPKKKKKRGFLAWLLGR